MAALEALYAIVPLWGQGQWHERPCGGVSNSGGGGNNSGGGDHNGIGGDENGGSDDSDDSDGGDGGNNGGAESHGTTNYARAESPGQHHQTLTKTRTATEQKRTSRFERCQR